MSVLDHIERGTLRTALGLLLAIGIVPIALGADGRPDGANYTPPTGERTISVTPTSNVADLLQCLLGPSVTVISSSLNAAAVASGTFSGALNVIGFDQGIVLGSGNVTTLVGPNVSDQTSTDNVGLGDPDLDGLVPGYTTFDAAVLTVQFTCATATVVSFQYVFGSEEYNEYVDSVYNDVFGFFLNGVNIAAVPAGCSNPGIPVAINNVNCGNPYVGSGPNCDCYRNNDLQDGGGAIDTELDGLTQIFTVTGVAHAGINTIKIAIADEGDRYLDSDVMIRCQSFACATSLPAGACCFTSGLCVTLTHPDCQAQSGDYYGDYIPCAPNPCEQPAGACCFPDGRCEMAGPVGCLADGGTYHGDGVLCNAVTCPQPVGACCDFATWNCEITIPDQCQYFWLGAGVPCNYVTCPAIGAPVGACCNHATGDCSMTTEAGCPFDFLGVDVRCISATCPAPEPVGACCYPPYDLCVVITHAACDSLSGQYIGDFSTCVPLPCPIRGACCFPTGECILEYPGNCSQQGGIYQGDAHPCDPNPCLPAEGACCDHSTGACAITTQAACAFEWLGAGVPCDVETCVPPVSTERTSWGRIKNIYR